MDRQHQLPDPNPPAVAVAVAAEKRARSLTRHQRVGIGVEGGGSKRSTTPTPQHLSFAKPSAEVATLPSGPSSSTSSSSSPPGNAAAATNPAKFSFGKPLGDPPKTPLPRPPTERKKSSPTSSSSNISRSNNNNNNNTSHVSSSSSTKDWLADTETQLRQDLETTKKELELIRTILWEIEMDDATGSSPSSSSPVATTSPPLPLLPETTMTHPSPHATVGKSQRKLLMAECREYAESRRQLVRERLRQVQFWAGSRAMGRRVPAGQPLEWALADAEWAKWLHDQATAMQQQANSVVMIEGEVGASWGPLPHILATFSFVVE